MAITSSFKSIRFSQVSAGIIIGFILSCFFCIEYAQSASAYYSSSTYAPKDRQCRNYNTEISPNTHTSLLNRLRPSHSDYAADVRMAALKENCTDRVDNDGDGYVDCADRDCPNETSGYREFSCGDGLDNDCDGHIDCYDIDCHAAASCKAVKSPQPAVKSWKRLTPTPTVNPFVYPENQGWEKGTDAFQKMSMAVNSKSVYQSRKLFRNNAIVKEIYCHFDMVSDIPATVGAGEEIVFRIKGDAEYRKGREYSGAEVCKGSIWALNEQGSTIFRVNAVLTINKTTDDQSIKFRFPALLPDVFTIYFGIENTAAVNSWMYEKR